MLILSHYSIIVYHNFVMIIVCSC